MRLSWNESRSPPPLCVPSSITSRSAVDVRASAAIGARVLQRPVSAVQMRPVAVVVPHIPGATPVQVPHPAGAEEVAALAGMDAGHLAGLQCQPGRDRVIVAGPVVDLEAADLVGDSCAVANVDVLRVQAGVAAAVRSRRVEIDLVDVGRRRGGLSWCCGCEASEDRCNPNECGQPAAMLAIHVFLFRLG